MQYLASNFMLSASMTYFKNPCYHLLSVIFFLLLLPSGLATREEGEALLNWKNSLSPSSFLESWSSTNLNNLCNWTGITCNSEASVSEINLSQKQLQGTLAEFRFNLLPSLKTFTISRNNFTGPIPSDIGNSTELQYVDFSFNFLNGFIPYQVSHLQRLRALDLSYNLLEAPNWSEFLPIPSLTKLYLRSNNLASKFPGFISSCQSLTYLDLSHNFITGDLAQESVFNKMINLESFSIRNNSIQGPFSPSIFSLVKLRFLDLSRNNF